MIRPRRLSLRCRSRRRWMLEHRRTLVTLASVRWRWPGWRSSPPPPRPPKRRGADAVQCVWRLIRALASLLVLAFALALALRAAVDLAVFAAAARAAMTARRSPNGSCPTPTAASCRSRDSEGRATRGCPPWAATPASTTQPAATRTVTTSPVMRARRDRRPRPADPGRAKRGGRARAELDGDGKRRGRTGARALVRQAGASGHRPGDLIASHTCLESASNADSRAPR